GGGAGANGGTAGSSGAGGNRTDAGGRPGGLFGVGGTGESDWFGGNAGNPSLTSGGGAAGASGAVSVTGSSISVSKTVGTLFSSNTNFTTSPYNNDAISGGAITLNPTNLSGTPLSLPSNGKIGAYGGTIQITPFNLPSTNPIELRGPGATYTLATASGNI